MNSFFFSKNGAYSKEEERRGTSRKWAVHAERRGGLKSSCVRRTVSGLAWPEYKASGGSDGRFAAAVGRAPCAPGEQTDLFIKSHYF